MVSTGALWWTLQLQLAEGGGGGGVAEVTVNRTGRASTATCLASFTHHVRFPWAYRISD